ncbi:quinolinate synthase NadA [bacterium]|nr:quinolinate synthase NadA [bacterium]MBU0899517.1 quinolinate synthase NadA [bacterium]MBU1152684.1 quinolinate synthase NadA [bacterium]MBU1782603.1 quinolinate synthase NadA [bacterium]MBU2599471.1 quinolinate synthase NadA [bacterium]
MQKDLVAKIESLKKEKKVVILAHNYQRGEVQDIADFVGDSIDLSRKAATTSAEIILFCGVLFMAEAAKILSPGKVVLLPDLKAGCPLANMITLKELRQKKKEYPGAVVVCYVNSAVEIKAESDICCTSANAVKVVESIPQDKEIIFIPDKWLGDYTSRIAKRRLILWDGYCATHLKILPENILLLKERYPKAEIIVHPECTRDVIEMADQALSTMGIVKWVKESKATEFIIGTENGIIHRLKKENPEKRFFPASVLAECPNMKLTTLEKVLWALEEMKYQIEIEEDIRLKAKKAVERMLEI